METTLKNSQTYFGFAEAAFTHSVVLMLRRSRLLLAALITFTPVLVPLALAFFSVSHFAEGGNRIFVYLIEILYLKAIVPLLALFFGTMLIGEDVESHTLPYLLVRPMPRSAIALGRFGAYLVVSFSILFSALTAVFVACIPLGGFPADAANLQLFSRYAGVGFVALLGYGSLTLFLGTAFKRPIVYGVLFIFPWQRMAILLPGALDLFTIEKYVTTLSPKLATEWRSEEIRSILDELRAQHLLVGELYSVLILVGAALVFLTLTTIVLRRREFAQAKAQG